MTHDITSSLAPDDIRTSVRTDIFMYSYMTYLVEATLRFGIDVYTLAQPVDDVFILCNFMSINDGLHSDLPCERVATFIPSVHPLTLSCTRVNLKEEFADTGLIVGLSLIVYLDRFSPDVPLYMFDNDLGQQSGIFVATTFPNNSAQVYSTASSFAPNTHSTLNIGLSERTMLPDPYSQCVEEGPNVYDLFGNHQPYAQEACVMACQQKSVEAECHCMYPPLYFSYEQRSYTEYTLPFCHHYNFQNISATVERVNCAQTTLARVFHECFGSCSPNCSDQWFTHYSTFTRWPQSNYQAAFYNRYIKNRAAPGPNDNSTSSQATEAPAAQTSSYERRLRHFAPVYDPIVEILAQGNVSQAHAMLKEERLIEENFVKLTINFQTASVQSVTATAKITASSFLSLLGGIFNLYAGISFVLIFEIIEFCARLVQHAWLKRRASHTSPDDTHNDVTPRDGIKQVVDATAAKHHRWVLGFGGK